MSIKNLFSKKPEVETLFMKQLLSITKDELKDLYPNHTKYNDEYIMSVLRKVVPEAINPNDINTKFRKHIKMLSKISSFTAAYVVSHYEEPPVDDRFIVDTWPRTTKTLAMKCTIGVNPGYFHDNKGAADIYSLLQQLSKERFDDGDDYISFVCYATKVTYNEDWGCPVGGEDTYTIEAIANPEFVRDLLEWKAVCTIIIEELKRFLGQSTVTVQFYESDILYLVK